MLGEDSGIEVDALGGGPGVESARWAKGREAEKLLEVRGTGVLEGEIARERRGSGGFGFDPVFVPTGETLTVAELGDQWKTASSHRARAARALAAALQSRS